MMVLTAVGDYAYRRTDGYWLYPSVPSRIDCHSTPLTLIPERRGRVAPGLKESRRKRTRACLTL